MESLIQTENILTFSKTYLIIFFTCYMSIKIINEIVNDKLLNIKLLIVTVFVTFLYLRIRNEIGYLYSIIALIFVLSIIISKIANKTIGYMFIIITISLTLNNILFLISSVIIVLINFIFNIKSKFIILAISIITYVIVVYLSLRIKKFKNGFSFLNKNMNNEYFEIMFLNMSAIILFSVVILTNYNINIVDKVGVALIILVYMMFTTIQKSLQLYYKQKLLEKELNETKDELKKKVKEVEELEAENLSFSKKSHTLAHKQKSLEYKLQEIMNKTEISKEQVREVEERLKEIAKDLYEEKKTIQLDKTGIEQIDDMLKYMQSECKKNNIDFELQLKGNIYYMTNNLISKEDLETLLADHIKNAIIAINHTDNINRSILVKLGKIDDAYGLYIYDSGIEFERETLENLGKKPSTTHADEGGTGMGFMNTFDTLRKCNASLVIEEFNKPTTDNYTKSLKFIFDNKNEFNIKSYREKISNSTL